MDLDTLLSSADPARPTTPAALPRFDELAALTRAESARDRDDVVPLTPRHRRQRRGRTARRVAVGGAAVLLALGGASVAAATPGAPSWLGVFDWRPDAVNLAPPGSCSAVAMRVGGVLHDPATEAAREYLRHLDIWTVDYSAQLEEAREAAHVNADGAFVGLGEGRLTEQQLVDEASSRAVGDLVWAHLAQLGLDARYVTVEGQMNGCDLSTSD